MHGIKILRCEESIIGNDQARVNSGDEWIRWVRKKEIIEGKAFKIY